MKIDFVAAAWLLAFALGLASGGATAQPQVGPAELARARVLLDAVRAQLTTEEFALLSGKLAEAESATAELTTVVRTSQAAIAVTEGGAAASAEAAATTGGRALLSTAAEVLPLLMFFWPATAHAPGVKQEDPKVQAAKAKAEEKLKELAEAARKVEAERRTDQSPRPVEPNSERRCPPCAGQLPSPRIDSDHAHHPCPGDHVHYFVWEQNPKTCQCFVKDRLACL